MSASMASEPTIRLARREDLPAMIDIFARDVTGGHAESREPAPMPVYEAAFDRIVSTPGNQLFVAELDGVVVGTCQLTLIPGLIGHGRVRAKVESVHVRADMRGRRIGEAMMRVAVAEARRQGAGMMELSSNKKRVDAHRFYERLGFARSHEGFKLEL
jgi:GNAT superfamily N-acetyltransferase